MFCRAMETVVVDVVPREVVGLWEPASMSPMYVHRISSEMREYHDLQNKDHDLVVSDPTRMRFLRAVIQESLLERFVVAIVDTQ